MGQEGGFKRLWAGLNTLSMSSSMPDKHELSYSLHQGCWPGVARGFQISSALTSLYQATCLPTFFCAAQRRVREGEGG